MPVNWLGRYYGVYFHIHLILNPDGHRFDIRALVTFCFGLAFTHLIRTLVKAMKILKKRFLWQVLYLLLKAFILSIIPIVLFVSSAAGKTGDAR